MTRCVACTCVRRIAVEHGSPRSARAPSCSPRLDCSPAARRPRTGRTRTCSASASRTSSSTRTCCTSAATGCSRRPAPRRASTCVSIWCAATGAPRSPTSWPADGGGAAPRRRPGAVRRDPGAVQRRRRRRPAGRAAMGRGQPRSRPQRRRARAAGGDDDAHVRPTLQAVDRDDAAAVGAAPACRAGRNGCSRRLASVSTRSPRRAASARRPRSVSTSPASSDRHRAATGPASIRRPERYPWLSSTLPGT